MLKALIGFIFALTAACLLTRNDPFPGFLPFDDFVVFVVGSGFTALVVPFFAPVFAPFLYTPKVDAEILIAALKGLGVSISFYLPWLIPMMASSLRSHLLKVEAEHLEYQKATSKRED